MIVHLFGEQIHCTEVTYCPHYSGLIKTVAEVADLGFCVTRSQTGVSDPGYRE